MTSGLVVSNAGPLITLAKIQRSQLLKGLFGQIVIPRAVFDEVVLRGAGEPGAEETRNARWIEISLAVDVLSVSVLRESLGAGESEAIVLAQELGADLLLLDDALARRKAERLGLKAIGTLGVLLLAKEAGLLDAVKPALIELQRTDFRASLRVYEEVLARAGEN
jgi:predicted nucleic acid-binding protein